MEKKKNKFGTIFIGLGLALGAVVAFYVVGRVLNPPSTTVYLAAQDISQGTTLADLSDSALTAVPVQGDQLLTALVTKADLSAMKAAGGAFVMTVTKGSPITLNMIASTANQAGLTTLSLANADPNLVIARLNVEGIIPDGSQVGDRVDVAVAVSSVRFDESYAIALANLVAKAQAEADGTSATFTPNISADDLSNQTVAGGSALLNDENMQKYFFQAPIAKIIVSNAQIVNIVRNSSQEVSTSQSGAASTKTVYGSIQYIDIMIPRDSFEWVAMGNAAGQLSVSLVSPMADKVAPPTIGATLQDLIDSFYSDRGLSVEDTVTQQ